jgi:hypothetical protein
VVGIPSGRCGLTRERIKPVLNDYTGIFVADSHEAFIMMTNLKSHLSKQGQTSIIFEALILIAIIGTLDLLTGCEISLSIFYLAPISFVVWYVGRSSGLMVAIVSALVWLLADIGAGHIYQHSLIPYWNTAVILGEFLLAVLVVSELKHTYEAQSSLVEELKEAIDNILTLRGLVPICARCKKIRDDKGYWQEVETYLAEHSEASFTHEMCPQCRKEMKKELQELSAKTLNKGV